MNIHSIGFRLTLWYAAILSAGMGLFGCLAYFSLRHELLREIDTELQGRADRFQTYFKTQLNEEPLPRVRSELVEFCQALPPGSFIHLQGDRGYAFHFPNGAGGAADLRTRALDFQAQGENFHLEVGGSAASVGHVLGLLRLLLWSLVPVVILFACACGAWLSHRALKPVRDIAAAASTIRDSGGRLPAPATRDELAYLTNVLNDMLEGIDRAVGTLSRFVADASHELRTPLAIILADAEVALKRTRSAESYRQSLEQVALEAKHMTRLVEDLLFLARHDGRLAPMPVEPVDLAALVEEVRAEIQPLAAARSIRIGVRRGADAGMIPANPGALRRLLLALLDNALKYSDPGGRVTIAIEGRGGGIEMSVEDAGRGIGAADLPHIFDRFYRADPSRSSGGHGLGLSLARSIARAHGADVEVASVEGEGSKFSVRFPVKCQPQEILS